MAKISQKEAVAILKLGGVGVLATDTLYGIVGSALSKKAVARIYRLRKRDPKKPFIILIASARDCARFGVKIDKQIKKISSTVWPGKVSVILPVCPRAKRLAHKQQSSGAIAQSWLTCLDKKYAYLHRGTETLAFRVPASVRVRRLLQKTGPLVAPSANSEGMPPATTVSEAKKYFGERVDFYINTGKRASAPSTLVAIESGRIVIKRQGSAKIKIAMACK